jgi:predicted transcriptional regulator
MILRHLEKTTYRHDLHGLRIHRGHLLCLLCRQSRHEIHLFFVRIDHSGAEIDARTSATSVAEASTATASAATVTAESTFF